jgi:hypothetical protein
VIIDEFCELEIAHGIIETSVRGIGQFSVIEDNDGSVRASSPVRRRETNRVVETQTQGSVSLGD